ncbi:MAG: RdgB/HAM1 family non-canonical purine NTP pyrophosphatase [Bdellovibrionales bacterium]
MELWIATGNEHKMTEFKTLLRHYNLKLRAQNELPTFFQPPETGKTFLENAQIKARALKAVLGEAWVLAEDSGLVCEGLNGQPGVFSARYAGEKASDMENYSKVLQMMRIRSPTNRAAHFNCTTVIISPQGEQFHFEGILKGQIAQGSKGTGGFGYDPIFTPEGETKTLAELGPAVKHQVSHRSKALQAAAELFKKIGS